MSRLHAHIGTFRQLELLLALHDAGSVKAAAERLHLTQPTVSMQLKKLAEAVGMPLYEQFGRRLHFTEAGLAVVATARQVLGSVSRLDMQLADLRGMKAGTLKLAVVTTAKYFVPHLLGPFCERFPHVDVELNVGNRSHIIERLRQGEDDFYVFSHLPAGMALESTEFLPNPLVAIAPENHALAGQKSIPLKRFAREPFLMREPGSGTRYALERYLARRQVDLNVRMTIESNEAIKHAVMSGLGVSILSSHTLAFGGDAGLVVLDVAQLPIPTHWYLVRPSGKAHSVLAQAFFDYLETDGRALLRV